VYRHFPQRSDLIAAVFRHEVDACADAAPVLAAEHAPGEALARWMERYMDFIAAKRGLATALHSGNPAFETLPAYFQKRLQPALRTLLEAAAASGEVCADVEPDDLLRAVASLCMSAQDRGPARARRMVALLVDGLRYGASPSVNTRSESSASHAAYRSACGLLPGQGGLSRRSGAAILARPIPTSGIRADSTSKSHARSDASVDRTHVRFP
jgi:AcrR family transcriptional regulator